MVAGIRGPGNGWVDWGRFSPELRSLARETDPELFYEGMFHLAQRLERAGRVDEAGLVYGAMLTPHPDPLPQGERAIPSHIQHQAQERLDVLRGGGSIPHQLENIGRGFSQSALNPGFLFGAMGMGLVGRGTQLLGMRWLSAASAYRCLGEPARRLANLLPGFGGFALEATMFPFAINGANLLLGRQVNWENMDHRILGSWFFLGGMRGGNFGARFLGMNPLVGSLGGVMLGQGAEVTFGLREWHGFSNFAVGAVGLWASLRVAGRFSHDVFGGRVERMHRAMELTTESRRRTGASAPRRFEWVDSISDAFNNLSGPQPLTAIAGVGSIPSPRRWFAEAPRRSLDDNQVFMVPTGGDGGSGGRRTTPIQRGEIYRVNRLLRPFRSYFIKSGVDTEQVDQALSNQGTMAEKVQVLMETLLQKQGEDLFYLDVVPMNDFKEILNQSPQLRRGVENWIRAQLPEALPPLMRKNLLLGLGFESFIQPLRFASPSNESMGRAHDPQTWKLPLKEFVERWCGSRQSSRMEWELIERRLDLLPSHFLHILAFYARVQPRYLPPLFFALNLLSSGSQLRKDANLRHDLSLKSYLRLSPGVLMAKVDRVMKRAASLRPQYFPNQYLDKFQLEKKLDELPPVLLDVLEDTNLSDASFWFLGQRLGLW